MNPFNFQGTKVKQLHRQNNTSFTSASISESTEKKILCILCMLFSLLPVVEAETLKPSVVALEGDAAEILCPTIKSYDSYFWRKGASNHDSTEVASFVEGEPRADSKSYKVTANGSFFFENVTQTDEGKYFCRGVSENSSSTAEIIVEVKASLQNFELSIDNCSIESSCSRYINLSEPMELICIAKNASPSMMLKWFNGSREIESNITVVNNQKDAPPSTTIISTLKAVFRTPVTLTCQAVDTKCRTDGGRLVNIRLEQPVPITNEKPAPDLRWMIVAVITNVFWIMCTVPMGRRSIRCLRNGQPSVPNNGLVPTDSVPTDSVPNDLVPNDSSRRFSGMSEEGV